MGGALRRARRLPRARGCSISAPSSLLAAAGLGLDVGALRTGSASPRSRRCSPTSTLLVRPGDLRRLDAAFFTVNGVISIVFFGFVFLDVVTR